MTPYTSTSGDGLKMETSTGEMGCTVRFLVKNHVKMTINLSHSDTRNYGPQRNLFSINKIPLFRVLPSWPLKVPHGPHPLLHGQMSNDEGLNHKHGQIFPTKGHWSIGWWFRISMQFGGRFRGPTPWNPYYGAV